MHSSAVQTERNCLSGVVSYFPSSPREGFNIFYPKTYGMNFKAVCWCIKVDQSFNCAMLYAHIVILENNYISLIYRTLTGTTAMNVYSLEELKRSHPILLMTNVVHHPIPP